MSLCFLFGHSAMSLNWLSLRPGREYEKARPHRKLTGLLSKTGQSGCFLSVTHSLHDQSHTQSHSSAPTLDSGRLYLICGHAGAAINMRVSHSALPLCDFPLTSLLHLLISGDHLHLSLPAVAKHHHSSACQYMSIAGSPTHCCLHSFDDSPALFFGFDSLVLTPLASDHFSSSLPREDYYLLPASIILCCITSVKSFNKELFELPLLLIVLHLGPASTRDSGWLPELPGELGCLTTAKFLFWWKIFMLGVQSLFENKRREQRGA